MSTTAERNKRRVLIGTVVSTKGAKTIIVEVERTYRHPKYGKFVRKKKKYMAHDEAEVAQNEDKVELVATRPLSKRKRWRLSQIVQKADGTVATVHDSAETSVQATLGTGEEEGGDS